MNWILRFRGWRSPLVVTGPQGELKAMTVTPLALLFTGHMIDLPGRMPPRFPPELADAARRAIEQRVSRHVALRTKGDIVGFASLARGGDILFHEVCRALGIPTVIVLPFCPDKFLKTSVEGAEGGDWPDRFRRMWDETMPDSKYDLGLPKADAAYAACNERLIELAGSHGAIQVIALWDRIGDGRTGGTRDFIGHARQLSDREPDIIDPKTLR